jgi:hypothetical protein
VALSDQPAQYRCHPDTQVDRPVEQAERTPLLVWGDQVGDDRGNRGAIQVGGEPGRDRAPGQDQRGCGRPLARDTPRRWRAFPPPASGVGQPDRPTTHRAVDSPAIRRRTPRPPRPRSRDQILDGVRGRASGTG